MWVYLTPVCGEGPLLPGAYFRFAGDTFERCVYAPGEFRPCDKPVRIQSDTIWPISDLNELFNALLPMVEMLLTKQEE